MADIKFRFTEFANKYSLNMSKGERIYIESSYSPPSSLDYKYNNTTNSLTYLMFFTTDKDESTAKYRLVLYSQNPDAVSLRVEIDPNHNIDADSIITEYGYGGYLIYNGVKYYYSSPDIPALPYFEIDNFPITTKKDILAKGFKIYTATDIRDAVMQSLRYDSQYTLEKSQISDLQYLIQSNTNAGTVFYGVNKNTGYINIVDTSNIVPTLVKDTIIRQSYVNAAIIINNNIIECIIDDMAYNEDRTIKLNLTNKGFKNANYKLQLINDKPIKYLFNDLRTIWDIKEDEFDMTYNVLAPSSSVVSVDELLNNIYIKNFYINNDTIENQMVKLLSLTQLALIHDGNKYKFIGARPIHTNESPIIIKKNNIYSEILPTLLVKNRYTGVNYYVNELARKEGTLYTSENISLVGGEAVFREKYPQYDLGGEYDLHSATGEYLNIKQIQFNYFIDLQKIDKIIDRSDKFFTDYCELNVKAYYGQDSSDSTTKTLDGVSQIIRNQEIPYHSEYNSAFFTYAMHNFLGTRSTSTSDQQKFYMTVRCNLQSYYTDMEGPWYCKNFVFSLSSPVYEENYIETQIGDAENNITLSQNELMQENTKYLNEYSMTDFIPNNILADYSNGIETLNITVSLANYYNKNGKRVKSLDNGDLISVGEIIQIEGIDKIWKVTGRMFRYAGCPFIDLELMEAKTAVPVKISISNIKTTTTINRISSKNKNVPLGEISTNEPVYVGDVIKFNVKVKSELTDGKIESLQISTDGTNFYNYQNNSEIEVNGDITLNAIAKSWERVGSSSEISLEHTINSDTRFSLQVDGLKSNIPTRISGVFNVYNPNNWELSISQYNKLELQGGEGIIDALEADSGGYLLHGTITLRLYKPTQDGSFDYINKTDNTAFYLRGLNSIKIEQYV